MKVFVCTTVDLFNVGYNPSHVDFFNTKSEAYRYLEREYLNHCKKEGIEDPYAEDSFDYQIGSDFAYIFGKYYWDIFEGDVEMV